MTKEIVIAVLKSKKTWAAVATFLLGIYSTVTGMADPGSAWMSIATECYVVGTVIASMSVTNATTDAQINALNEPDKTTDKVD